MPLSFETFELAQLVEEVAAELEPLIDGDLPWR